MFLENGTSTINCFISPTEESRNQAQKVIGERFRLIYIKASHDEVKKAVMSKDYIKIIRKT